MKKIHFLSLLLITLASCSSNKSPLSESECKTLADKEATHLASRFERFPDMKAGVLRLADSRAEQCAAGGSFDREDYECVVSANSDSSMDKCLSNAAKRSRQRSGA